MPPQYGPIILSTFISLTCGQDVTVQSFMGISVITISCTIFNGTNSLARRVYKDGVLLDGIGFPMTIKSPSASDFGTYTFEATTTDCGSAVAVSRVLKQGEFTKCHVIKQKIAKFCLLLLI